MNEWPAHDLICEIGIGSEKGPRARNEDFLAAIDDRASRVICAIADGMGGRPGGREAAETCVRMVLDALAALPVTIGPRRACMNAIEPANGWIHAIGQRDPALAGMGCTLTVAILQGRRIHVAHAGDTRLYRFRDGKLSRLTRDHNGGTPDTRHLLTRAIGLSDTIRIDYDSDEVRPHDRYLLCSDGLYHGVPDPRLAGLLAQTVSAAAIAAQLVAEALAAHSGDNASALVLDVLALPPLDTGSVSDVLDRLPVLAPPRLGAVIDGYALHGLLADGRYSRVFRARDGRLGREAILKFPQAAVGADAALRQVFLREAMVAGAVHSPFVGEVAQPDPERQSALYLVMPFYDGETLERRLLGPRPVRLAEGLAIARKLARAAIALHRRGIIHRDIKPDNVILESNGGVKLIDLGVARLPQLDDAAIVSSPGTPSYMAPELRDGVAASEQSDLYALAVTIYRMFARAYPYGEVEPFSRPRFGRPAPLLQHRPDLPAWLDRALLRTLAVDAAARPADVLEFLFELEHGELRAQPAQPVRRSLYERNPVRFWQIVALLLALAVVLLLSWK